MTKFNLIELKAHFTFYILHCSALSDDNNNFSFRHDRVSPRCRGCYFEEEDLRCWWTRLQRGTGAIFHRMLRHIYGRMDSIDVSSDCKSRLPVRDV